MGYRIVIVEDSPAMVESLIEVLRRELGEVDIVVSGFAEAPLKIAASMPDVVVLDILDDQVEEHPEWAVQPAFRYVWDEHFCPIVFHSAQEVDEYKQLKHPFTRYEVKGRDNLSLRRVAEHIKSFSPEIEGLRQVRRELSRHAGAILRHVGRTIWQGDRTPAQQTDLFLCVARRRMAAALDYVAEHETRTQAWEQYIYPPIGDDLLTGDLIRSTDANPNDVAAYRLVLSPSCDLVRGRGKTLDHLLVAECVLVNEFLAKAGIHAQKLKDNDHRRKLLSELSKDQVAGLAVLPVFPEVLPLMAANLRRLSLIAYADVATKNGEAKPFVRIASVDSPFRERLAWAYLQIAGRPGIPDVDREALADSIAQTIAPVK